MDPITVALVAIGAGTFLLMVLFLIDYIGTLIEEVNEARDRAIKAKAEAEEMIAVYERQLEEDTRQEQKIQEKLNRLNYLRTKLKALESKFDKESIIFGLIEGIIDGGIVKIARSIYNLVQLIKESFFLSKNLKTPKNSIKDIRKEIEQLEKELELLMT